MGGLWIYDWGFAVLLDFEIRGVYLGGFSLTHLRHGYGCLHSLNIFHFYSLLSLIIPFQLSTETGAPFLLIGHTEVHRSAENTNIGAER